MYILIYIYIYIYVYIYIYIYICIYSDKCIQNNMFTFVSTIHTYICIPTTTIRLWIGVKISISKVSPANLAAIIPKITPTAYRCTYLYK
jgi:hypothetical protein